MFFVFFLFPNSSVSEVSWPACCVHLFCLLEHMLPVFPDDGVVCYCTPR